MNSYNVGIIGYGWVAGAHITALQATGRAPNLHPEFGALDGSELSAQHEGAVRVFQDLKFLAQPDLGDLGQFLPAGPRQPGRSVAQAGKRLILNQIALNRDDHPRPRRGRVRRHQVASVSGTGIRADRTAKAFLDQGLLGRVHYAEVDYFHGIGPWYGSRR